MKQQTMKVQFFADVNGNMHTATALVDAVVGRYTPTSDQHGETALWRAQTAAAIAEAAIEARDHFVSLAMASGEYTGAGVAAIMDLSRAQVYNIMRRDGERRLAQGQLPLDKE